MFIRNLLVRSPFRFPTVVMASSSSFDPAKSRVSENALADFIRSPLTGDLQEIPGIGAASVRALQKCGIQSSFALIGKYLMLKDTVEVTPIEHAERFYLWLGNVKDYPSGFRAGTVHAICEKCNIMMPGIYDATAYMSLY